MTAKLCDVCGRPFKPASIAMKRCSPACSHKAKLRRQRAIGRTAAYKQKRNARRRKAYAENRHGIRERVLAQQKEWRKRQKHPELKDMDDLSLQIFEDLKAEAKLSQTDMEEAEILESASAEDVQEVIRRVRAELIAEAKAKQQKQLEDELDA